MRGVGAVEDVAAALRIGATSVVVGAAITDPAFLTARFAVIVSGQGRVAPGQFG